MRIDQALFGELRSAHSVLGFSGDEAVARAILPKTDYPDQVPPGITIPPYVSGFTFAGRFVLTRTILDPNADRAGMVRTHALLMQPEDARSLIDLRPLLERLQEGPPLPDQIVAFDHEDRPTAPATSKLLPAAAQTLVAGLRPVIFDGTGEEYESLVAALWTRIPADLRKKFGFRISFGVRDLERDPPDLVWMPTGIRTPLTGVMPREPQGDLPSGADLLIAGTDALALEELARDLELVLATFSQIEQLGACLAMSREDSVVGVAKSLRIVARLQPDPDLGIAAKTQLVDRLVKVVGRSGPRDLLPLRNLELPAFGKLSELWRTVSEVVASAPIDDGDRNAVITVLQGAQAADQAVHAWKEAVWMGWAKRKAAGETASLATAAFAGQPEAIVEALGRLPVSQDWDLAIAESMRGETVLVEGFESLLEDFKMTPRPHAHAALAARVLSPTDAVIQHLTLPGEDGLSELITRVPAVDLISLAIERGDRRLVAPAAEMVAAGPGRLGARNPAHNGVQKIWAAALELDPGAWTAPADPHKAVRLILRELVEHRPLAAGLTTALATSPLADLSAWPDRAPVWAALPQPEREHFLAATAEGWISRLQDGSPETELDSELRLWVLDRARLGPFLKDWAINAPEAGLRAFDALGELTEEEFDAWMSAVLKPEMPIPLLIASRIGELVVKRGWRRIAGDLLYAWLSGHWQSLKPALDAASELLTLYDRVIHGLRKPSENDLWALLEEVALEVYARGPDESSLWSRAGGKTADLPRDGSGRDRWRATLSWVRNGAPVRPARLVREMLRDVPCNQTLRFLAARVPFAAK